MALNLTGLTAYVDEQRLPLIKKAVIGGRTLDYINLQAGIKGSAAINLLDINPTLQKGSCGFNASGDAKFSQRKINTELMKVNMEFCEKDFRNYWTNYELKFGAGKETLPFEEYITNGIVEGVHAETERLIWVGDKSKSDMIDGFVTLLEREGRNTASTASSVYDAIKDVYKDIPVAVLKDAVIFIGADTFRTFALELAEKNLYHYSADNTNMELILPATNVKVIAMNGLNGSGKIIGANPMNLFYGCDMLDDEETFDLFYSKDNQVWRLVVNFNAGVQVAYPSEVVMHTID